MLSFMLTDVYAEYRKLTLYAECHFALYVVMLSVFMLRARAPQPQVPSQ
jgi:hypothetical protein